MESKLNKVYLNIAIILSVIGMILLIINSIRWEAYGDYLIHIGAYVVTFALLMLVKIKFSSKPKFNSSIYGGLLIGFIVFTVLHLISMIVGFSVNLYDSGWGLIYYFYPFTAIPFLVVGLIVGYVFSLIK